MKTLTQTLTNYVAACFSGLWVETFEPDEAIREITALCKNNQWNLATWDIDAKFQHPVNSAGQLPPLARASCCSASVVPANRRSANGSAAWSVDRR